MSDIEIPEVGFFRCGKMPTRVQWHVVKRLVPVMQGLAPIFQQAANTTVITNPETGDTVNGLDNINVFEAVAAITNTIGMLSDGDADYIIDAALSQVAWRQGDRWHPLRAPGGHLMNMNADNLDVQMRLVWEVLRESLSSFSFARVLPSQAPMPNGTDPTEPMAALVRRPTASSP